MQAYIGRYEVFGFILDVTAVDGELLAAMPGVPAGYEIVLAPVGENSFHMSNGPLRGAVLNAVIGENGVAGFQVGPFLLTKIEGAALSPETPRLLAPPLHLDSAKETTFAALLADILAGQIDWIDERLTYPKHEFVQYVMAQDVLLFHGSNRDDIEIFEPVRKSVELRDETGRGNQQGIYATHDGLWSMFFSVIDRGRMKGSIRNGVSYFHNRAGEALAVYNFSINQHQLAERPYCNGALYLLPRSPFRRLMMFGEIPSNEWVCGESLRPLARLRMTPSDFPFLEQISGHDDGPLLRLNELSRLVRTSARWARDEADRFVVALPQETDLAAQLAEYITLLGELMPGSYHIEPQGNEIRWIVQNPSPAQRQTLKESYQALLIPQP
ncbi:MAG: hypothetical protein KF893_18075 [Caldilineaceae bacterium]|nr:hypothetical protein [Caldilineaceae bacterium]